MHYLKYTVEQLIYELKKYPLHYLVAAYFDYEITGEMKLQLYNPADLDTEVASIELNGTIK